MIEFALVIVVGLYILGIVKIPGVTIPNYHLFTLNHHTVTLFNVLTVFVIFGVLFLLPRFMRIVVGALLIIWIIALLGIINVQGLPAITILILIGVIFLHRSFHWYHRYRRYSERPLL